MGNLTFFRVYSGVVNSGDTILNSVKAARERFGRIVQMHANKREEIKEVRAGDIAAAIGLKDVIRVILCVILTRRSFWSVWNSLSR